ncbi:lasso peptide biosynthesis B2 protein [Sphingopyxis sp. KK2]|uniref:lasso peptide biosynthesis B2 protein n=1 Tax=Sphingopyxis sp. KK2 TaxID=1855727 RepID=UPI0015C3469F|nr:lasso peptide biosynthesis B2 protein [Sphingopyxis sp. KK2]
MDYHLPAHISFAAFGSKVVCLDVSADRYFLLRGEEASALLAADFAMSPPPQSVLAHGFLQSGRGAAVLPVVALPVAGSALECPETDGRLSATEVAWFRMGAALALRVRGLEAMFADLRLQRSRDCRRNGTDDPGLQRVTAARMARGYARARLFVPAARLCVPDSIALARSLWRRGIGADLYFGVRLEPFAAHCWLQHGDLLLTDPVNFVADYTPVFRL